MQGNQFSIKFGQKKIQKLYFDFTNGQYNNILFKYVFNHHGVESEDIQMFHNFIGDDNLLINIASLKIIIKFSDNLDVLYEYVRKLDDTTFQLLYNILLESSVYRQNDQLLLLLMGNKKQFFNKMIISLKNLNKTDKLTPLLFNKNIEVVKLVQEVING